MQSFLTNLLSLLLFFIIQLNGYTAFDQYANSLSATSGESITGGTTR